MLKDPNLDPIHSLCCRARVGQNYFKDPALLRSQNYLLHARLPYFAPAQSSISTGLGIC